jgi:tetratricopeptide (TPR) repeat protein
LCLLASFFIFGNNFTRKVQEQPVVKNVVSKFNLESFKPVSFKKPLGSALLPSAKWVPQTFNNCGPAATSMVLQYFGFNVSQVETKEHLRTNPSDTNVFINEISAYLKKDYGIESKVFINGDLQTVKTLVANGVYVVVEDWLHPNEDIGHVLIIRGFDDNERVLIADDSYFGVGIKYPYSTWEETQWKPYGREFMPVYLHENEDLVRSIVGANWSEKIMYQNSVARNQKDVDKNPNDMYAWFNLGTAHFALGEYEKAKVAFEKSENIGWPHRMLWYQIQPIQTYNKLGEYRKALATADLALWFNDSFAEVHYEKAISYKGLGESQNAKNEAQKALDSDPGFTKARDLIKNL